MLFGEGTVLELEKDGSVQGRVVTTKIKGDKNDLGGSYDKTSYEAKIVGLSGNAEISPRKMNVVIKVAFVDQCKSVYFGDEKEGMSESRKYYERWKFLKSIGVPTATSMRVVDEKSVAMGDMTWDGSQFFGKAKLKSINGERDQEIKRDLLEAEKIFLSIDPNEIKKEFVRIQEKCWDNGIRLPFDDMFDLIVHPDGKWEVLVLDLTFLDKREGEKHDDLILERQRVFEKIDNLRKGLLNISKNYEGKRLPLLQNLLGRRTK